MRQEIARLVHDIDSFLAVGNSDVHVQSEDEVRARDLLHVFDDGGVALVHRDQLVHPMRERMRAGRCDFQSIVRREHGELAAKLNDLLPRTTRITANLRAKLDDRLVHLRLDVLFQNHFAVGQNFLDVRTQLARFRIDDLKFLFDAESENVIASAHGNQTRLAAEQHSPSLAFALQKLRRRALRARWSYARA